jgi:5'-nucleotidase
VYATGIPETVVADQEVSFDLTKLNLAGATSVVNTDLDVWLRPAAGGQRIFVDSYDVETANEGSASVSFTAPSDLVGDYTVVATAQPSGTTVGIGQTATTVKVAAVKATYGKAATLKITTAPEGAGTVKVYKGATLLGSGTVTAGAATVKLGKTALRPGSHTLTLRYSGDGADLAASEGTAKVSVAKGATKTNAAKKSA